MAATLAARVVVVEEVPLLGAPARITDHPGGSTGERQRPVAVLLEAAQHDQPDQVAVVEAGGRRVDTVVERDRSLREAGGQRGPIRGVVHQATLF